MYSNENEYVPYATYLQLPIFFLFFSFQTEKSKKKFWNLDRKKNIYLPFVHTKNIIFLHFIGKPQVGRKNLYGRELFFCKIIVFLGQSAEKPRWSRDSDLLLVFVSTNYITALKSEVGIVELWSDWLWH